MIAYFALLIPLFASLLMLRLFRKKITWWEILIPMVATLIMIAVFDYATKKVLVQDVEYRGSLVQRAAYYEYWETYVEQTCTRQVACGETCSTDSKGNRTCVTQYCTETYDCSYCDENGPEWEVIDDEGNTWNISQSYYNKLMKRWKATPQFVELNRDINEHGSCGRDGDKYIIEWNQQMTTSEPATWTHRYENKVQASHSAFKLPHVSEEEARKKGLYDYPAVTDIYKQEAILGLERIYSKDPKMLMSVKHWFKHLNGKLGHERHNRLYVLLFYDKPQSVAFSQEAYWHGGNDNELVVCIGLSSRGFQMQWVRPFSWTDNKRLAVEIREELMEQQKTFDPSITYRVIETAVAKYFKPKNFADFNYLRVELPTSSIIWIVVLTILITGGSLFWAIKNDIDS